MIVFSNLGNLGRLGNQLFQMSAAITLGEQLNTKVKFPKWNYKMFFEGEIDDSLVSQEYKHYDFYIEPFFNYFPIPGKQNLNLFGYFQSEKYFNVDLIRQTFTFKPYHVTLLETSYKTILNNQTTCSIHVRRTDYLEKSEYHYSLPLSYYYNAMKLIEEKVNCFLCFSDDIKWCKENLKHKKIIYIENQEDIYDLMLMSLCTHHIIANSSFSWWGSWLNNNKDKIVVAPKTWFGPEFKGDSKDLYCDNWILVN